jgi:S1-C subfamily serine protease
VSGWRRIARAGRLHLDVVPAVLQRPRRGQSPCTPSFGPAVPKEDRVRGIWLSLHGTRRRPDERLSGLAQSRSGIHHWLLTGSGEIIRSNGYIITNNHVISLAEGGCEISVLFSAGHSAPATITGRDPKADLAVDRVDKHPSSITVTSGISVLSTGRAALDDVPGSAL